MQLRRNYEHKYCLESNEREHICHPKIIYRWTMEKGFNTKFFSFSPGQTLLVIICIHARTHKLDVGGVGVGVGVGVGPVFVGFVGAN